LIFCSCIVIRQLEESKEIAEELDAEIRPPRVAAQKKNQKSNHLSTNHEAFFRISIFVPYLDSDIVYDLH